MPILEDTKYRVYYLINNGVCDYPDSKFMWNPNYENQGTEDQINRYIVIEAETDEKFMNVTVKAHEETKYLHKNKVEKARFRTMPWNDIDEDIIDIVNIFYSKRDNGDLRRRQISYADRIQRLFENPAAIDLKIIEGSPKVSITGLPYLFTAGRERDFEISIEERYGTEFILTIDRGWGDGPLEISLGQLSRVIRDSMAYSELLNVIEKHLGVYDYED